MARLFILLLILLKATVANAGHVYKEKEYQNAWCARIGGITEVVLDDGTRVDCLTDKYAIEVDFAPKWAEAVGQALYYALKTDRRPGILLILENQSDERFQNRVNQLGYQYGIIIWTIRQRDLEKQNSTEGMRQGLWPGSRRNEVVPRQQMLWRSIPPWPGAV